MKKLLSLLLTFVLVLSIVPVTVIEARTIQLNIKSARLTIGEKIQLELRNTDSTKITSVKWKSGSNDIATVSKKGTVKAVDIGTIYIIATYKKRRFKCKIVVYDLNESMQQSKNVDPNDKIDGQSDIAIQMGALIHSVMSYGEKNDNNEFVIHDSHSNSGSVFYYEIVYNPSQNIVLFNEIISTKMFSMITTSSVRYEVSNDKFSATTTYDTTNGKESTICSSLNCPIKLNGDDYSFTKCGGSDALSPNSLSSLGTSHMRRNLFDCNSLLYKVTDKSLYDYKLIQ